MDAFRAGQLTCMAKSRHRIDLDTDIFNSAENPQTNSKNDSNDNYYQIQTPSLNFRGFEKDVVIKTCKNSINT